MNIKKVGVVGCGTMGSGITQICAQSGFNVIVSEINKNFLHKGLASINAALSKSVAKGKILPKDQEATLSRINGTIDINDFRDCDLMIEAAIENLELKKKIFTGLDKICPRHTILTTNTSCLSVTDLAASTGRAEKVLGLHFFNPPSVMALLEISVTMITSQDTIAACKAFGEALGKTTVVVKDTPGFIANRLALPFILNAIRMLENGMASRDDIDVAVRLGYNHPSGPLAVADLIGLDVLYSVVDSIYQELKDPQFVPPVLLKKMVVAGLLGRKTGKGFYEYK
jgi:3-hydroxybutyryl-CoA dehydrogenase